MCVYVSPIKVRFLFYACIYVTGSRKRDHFADLLKLRYRRLNSDNNNKTLFADLSILLADGSRIFPLPLYQFEALYCFLSKQACHLKTATKSNFVARNSMTRG